MPDKQSDWSPDPLLEFATTIPDDDFVARVMRRVKREQSTRKLILLVSGLIGALFGIGGTVLLSESINSFITFWMSTQGPLPTSFTIIAVVAFIGWLFSDETSLAE